MLISNRANTILLVAILAVGIALIAMQASGARGGPLDPPAAPAATDGVREPGTPISSLPYSISQPGRYYVTRNLSWNSGKAITIDAGDVILDLGGFTIDGGGNTDIAVFGGLGATSNVSIENGTIRGFASGIVLFFTLRGHISGVHVFGQGSGTGIDTATQATIEDCEVTGGGTGVYLTAKSVMRRCYIHDLSTGVTAETDSVIEDSVIAFASFRGVETLTGTGVTIRNNRFRSNGPARNSDVVIGNGAALVIDNAINCTTSVSATGPGAVVTSSPGGGHENIPLYLGPTYC